EGGKSDKGAELGPSKFQGTRNLFHRAHLGISSHTGYGNTYVDRRTHACVKQVGFQEYLPVGNGNHVGGDISRNIARLSFNDGQGGKRTATFYFALKRGRQVVHRLRDLVGLVDLGCTLQQTGVQVEHVSGIGFAAGWTAEQQGNFPVSHGLLGQVVVYDQCR